MELKCTGKTRLRTGHMTIGSLMRCVRLAKQSRENTNKYHHASTTNHKESGELIHAWLGVRAHTTRWSHAVQKAEKVE